MLCGEVIERRDGVGLKKILRVITLGSYTPLPTHLFGFKQECLTCWRSRDAVGLTSRLFTD